MHRARAGVGLAAGVFALCTIAFATPAHADPAPELTTDSGSAPLLGGGVLKPGVTQENCSVLSYKHLQTDTTNGIGMYAAVTGTGLADYLDLTILAGSGGRYGDCSGFTGALVYSGTLGAFGGAHNAPANQRPLTMVGGRSGDVTVRVVVTMRDANAAQGTTTDAAFSWTVGPMTPPPPAPTAVPTPKPTTRPTGSPASAPVSEEPAPAPTVQSAFTPSVGGLVETADAVPASPVPVGAFIGPPAETVTVPLLPPVARPPKFIDESAPPGETAEEVPAGRAETTPPSAFAPPRVGGGVTASPAKQIREAITQLITGAHEAATAAAAAAPAAAKGGALGLAALPLVLVFLLVQKRLDERDPKLALAPSHQDAFLTFDDDLPPTDLVTS